MKISYEDAAKISYLADRAMNLASEIKQMEAQLGWLRKAHNQVVEDAKIVHELLQNADVEEEIPTKAYCCDCTTISEWKHDGDGWMCTGCMRRADRPGS